MNFTALAKPLISVSFSIFFAILLGLSACEEPKEIGFDLIPRDEVGVFFSDTFTVEASTVLADTFLTRNTLNLLVGKYQDPALGTVTASPYFETIPATDTLRLNRSSEREPIFDSLVLSLNLVYLYANTNTSQTFSVHRLTENIDSETQYTSNSTRGFEPTPLASFTGVGDDILDDGSNITIKLDDAFGQEIFNLANTEVTTEAFRETFKGLTLQADASDDAGILGFTTITPSSLILYYTAPEPKDDGSGDTLINRTLNLFISNGNRFNQVESDYTGTNLAGITPLVAIPSSTTNDLVYLQSGSGLGVKLEFPTLQRLQELGQVSINQAELLIYTEAGSTEDYDPPSQLLVYQTDDNNKSLFDEGGIARVLRQEDGSYPLLYEGREQSYRGSFSLAIQDLFSGNSQGNALLISSLPVTPDFGRLNELGVASSPSVNRTILNSRTGDEFNIKLRLFYTIFR